MEINPVFRRESRVRWRGNRAFLLLMLLATALSLVMAFLYAMSDMGGQDFMTSERLRKSGHDIFRALSGVQLGAWLLIVPALAAPGVAYERERGLLEALQLSGLAAWRVALGKFAGVILFSFLLLSVSAPPLALCFIIGGVAPAEFIGILKLHITIIIFCAALGLYFSARAQRPQLALRNAFVALMLFLLVTTYGPELFSSLLRFLAEIIGVPLSSGVLQEYASLFEGLEMISPLWVFEEVFVSNSSDSLILNQQLSFFIVASLVLLLLATRYAARALPDPQWQQRRRYLTLRKGRLVLASTDGWGALESPSAPTRKTENKKNEKPAAWDVPLTSFVRFHNPVMQREVRGLLRLRRFSRWLTLLLWLAGALCLVAYAWALMWMLGFPEATFDVFQPCALLAMLIVMLAAPLRGANSIARERENGTWETLRLSLLEPRMILQGKALAPLVPLTGVLLVTAPLWVSGTLASLSSGNGRGTLSLSLVFGTLALLYGTLFLFNAWGLWFSWRCRSSGAAMGWTIGSSLLILITLNLFTYPARWFVGILYSIYSYHVLGLRVYPGYMWDALNGSLFERCLFDLERMLNPWSELLLLLRQNSRYGYYNYGYFSEQGVVPMVLHPFVAALLYFFVGWVLLRHLERQMKQAQILERETAPRVTLDLKIKQLLQQLQGR